MNEQTDAAVYNMRTGHTRDQRVSRSSLGLTVYVTYPGPASVAIFVGFDCVCHLMPVSLQRTWDASFHVVQMVNLKPNMETSRLATI
jgi:hypothetical protein